MMRNFFCNLSFRFVMLLVVGLLICDSQPVFAKKGDSLEQVQKVQQLKDATAEKAGKEASNSSVFQSDDSLSKAETFFVEPAPELGSSYSGPSMIAEDVAAAEQDINKNLIVPEVDRNIKQFGYDFFTKPDGSFIPDMMAPAGPSYVLGPGDRLLISVWGSIEGNHEVVVGRNGEIVLPKIGAVSVWGQRFAEAKDAIRKHIEKYYSNFDLSVTLAGLRTIQIFMVGEVSAPGTYSVSSLSTVLTALVDAGGPAKTGSLRNIQLRRGGQLIDTVDFYDFLLYGDNSHDRTLQAGDTIFVPVVGPLVGVAGDVRRPAIYELQQGETLETALDLAGGLNSTAFVGKVQIERVDSHTRRFIMDVDLNQRDAMSLPVQDQDMVKVPSISPMTASYVRLTGYVSRPGQYQFFPGMRVADLILPFDNLLPMYYPDMAEILRLDPPEYRPRKMTIDLSLALAGDARDNIELQEFDELRLFSRHEMEEIPEVLIAGAVLQPGKYRLFEGMRVRDLIVASGNLRQDAYLADSELTQYFEVGRETRSERKLIDLGKAMQGDPTHNLQLRADDHLLVRSIPDFNRRAQVQVKGNVLFPGSYTVAKGEHLSSVLERAGGFAEGAYLRGTIFTRKSVEDLVRERMQKLVMQEEATIIRVSTEIAQGAFSEADVLAAQNMLESRKQLLDKLKSTPVMGRMVVQLSPLDELRGSEFDIELMDGDTIAVPEAPQSVSVLGEVYNPTSILYQPGRTTDFYLTRVGGPNENANENEMFIVRADGSVNSKKQGGSSLSWDDEHNRWVSGSFASIELYPGDTILVPQQFKRTDWMRELKDITTIIYQMALGAAAVASF